MLAYLILLQSVAGPAFLTPRPLRATTDCAAKPAPGSDDAITVCGTPQEAYRLRPLREKFEAPTIPKAETGLIGKARIAAETEQGTLAGGQTSKRAMVRLKMPF